MPSKSPREPRHAEQAPDEDANQSPSEAIRGHQRPSEAIRGHQRPSEVISAISMLVSQLPPSTHSVPVAIRANQSQSEPVRANQSQSEPIRANQRHAQCARRYRRLGHEESHAAEGPETHANVDLISLCEGEGC